MAVSYSQQVGSAFDTAAEEKRKRAQQEADILQQQGDAYIGNLEAAQAAQAAANAQASQNYNDLMAKYNNDFAAMVQGESDRIRQEREEAKTMIQADQKAAQWSGLTELASSVANMIGVGSFNAVNQQYKPMSQDWMRKADQDLREHRMRMDNIRQRQNMLKQQQLNLQMGQAGQALAREQERINREYQNAANLGQARYNANMAPVQHRAQGEDAADELKLKGAQQAASVGLSERQLAQRASEFNAQMAAKGLNPDGTPNEDLMQKHVAAAAKVNGATGSKNSGIPIKITVDGKDKTLYIEKEAYQNALKRSIPDLKEDVLAMAKKQNPDIKELKDLVGAAENKKIGRWPNRKDNPLYGNDLAGIAELLEKPADQYTEEDWDAISSWAQSHYDETENLNRHLVDVGNGARDSFWQDEAPVDATQTTQTAVNSATPRLDALLNGTWNPNQPWGK